jgi:hypothetical protein
MEERKMNEKDKVISTIPFVRRADYPEMLRICDDPENLPPDYDSFLKHFDNLVQEYEKAGLGLVRVDIKPGELAEWCRSQNRKIDGKARAAYAMFVYTKTQNPSGQRH